LALAVPLASAVQAKDATDTGNAVEEVVVTGSPDQARAEIGRTAGAVQLITDATFRNTPVQHIKDILGYAPGVITQTRMGDDARVSIRGSGLSRAYGARGISLTLDGVPLNTSDGLVDFFEIDPS